MAAGVPIVSTGIGDIFDMVGDENRHFVTGHSDRELAASLQILMASGAGKCLAEANLEKVTEDYSLRAMTKAWSDLLQL